jgi:hypothetical protein
MQQKAKTGTCTLVVHSDIAIATQIHNVDRAEHLGECRFEAAPYLSIG